MYNIVVTVTVCQAGRQNEYPSSFHLFFKQVALHLCLTFVSWSIKIYVFYIGVLNY